MGREWFNDDFLDAVVDFCDEENRYHSSWTLLEKLSDHGAQFGKNDAEESELYSSARAVFRCSKESGSDPQEAIVKVFMQIPWWKTEKIPAEAREVQAVDDIDSPCWWEIEGLKALTAARSESTPHLLAKRITKQHEPYMWIPGGFITYILMTKLRGKPPYDFDQLPLSKREVIRQSFKKAWLECRAAGIVHGDRCRQNLLWDDENNKCYIIDFGRWQDAQHHHVWRDSEFLTWQLLTHDRETGRDIP